MSSLNSVVKAWLPRRQKQSSCLTVAMLGFHPASFTDKRIFPFTTSLILAFLLQKSSYLTLFFLSLLFSVLLEDGWVQGIKRFQSLNLPLVSGVCFVLLFACFSTESRFPALLTLHEKVWAEVVLKKASLQYLWSEASHHGAGGKLSFRGKWCLDSCCWTSQGVTFFVLDAVQMGTREQSLPQKPHQSSLPI